MATRRQSRLTVTPLRRPPATLDPEAAAEAAATLEEQRLAAVRNNSVTEVTGQLGTSVFLPCRTTHSMERQVRGGVCLLCLPASMLPSYLPVRLLAL